MIILVSADMKTRVALCVNKNIGLKITQFLKNDEDTEICLLYLTGDNKTHDSKIIKASEVKNKNIFRGNEIYKTDKHINFFKKKKVDFLITVYWPWILQESFFQLAKQTINFHPSLLPMNRGWYPHVHNIISNTRSGVTLHQISKKADEGKIWCQKEVKVNCTDTAKNLYDRLSIHIESLFKSNWNKIKNNKLKAFEQDHSKAIYYNKKDAQVYDEIDITKKIYPLELINILRARTFGKKSFAYYKSNNEKIYINLSLSKNF